MTILKQIAVRHGVPKRIQTDNGSEFASRAFNRWAYEQGVTLDFSRPGRPTDNPFTKSFNGSFRDECLNTRWFLSLDDAREKIESWWVKYNDFRPHSALGNLPPRQFAQGLVSYAQGPVTRPAVPIWGEAQRRVSMTAATSPFARRSMVPRSRAFRRTKSLQ